MKRGVWVVGLILSLSGWTSNLFAQDGAWRPSSSGQSGLVPTTLAPSDLRPCPAAAIGRPMVVAEDPNPPPIILGPSPSDLLRTSYQPPLFPAGSAAPSAKDIPGGDRLPTWSAIDDDKPVDGSSTGFASDRVQPIPAASVNGSTVKQVGLATVAPTTPVPPTAASSASAWACGLPTTNPPWPDTGNGNPYPYPYPVGESSDPLQFGNVPHEQNPLYSHFYVSAEYLLWWTKKDSTPALVSTSTSGAADQFGFLNQSSTSVLFGGPYDGDARSGFRANAGMWLDTWCEEAVEFGGFFLAQKNTSFGASSSQYSVLARPFFNANSNTEFAELVAAPGISTGSVSVNAPSNLWGLDTNLRCNVCTSCNYRFDLLVGLRYLNLKEGVFIGEDVLGEAGAPAPFANANTTVLDSFATQNQFFGGQIGFDSEWKSGPWSLDLRGKLALGATQQTININGVETITPLGGATTTYNGGLLALPSNIGNHTRTEFSVVPEVGLTVGYQLTNTIRLFAGYNFLYWTNVVRPGAQIDRNLDVTQIPNFNIAGATALSKPTPTVPFAESSYWAQGIMVGVEFRY